MTNRQAGFIAAAVVGCGVTAYLARTLGRKIAELRADRQIDQALALVAQHSMRFTSNDVEWLEGHGVVPESLTEQP